MEVGEEERLGWRGVEGGRLEGIDGNKNFTCIGVDKVFNVSFFKMKKNFGRVDVL